MCVSLVFCDHVCGLDRQEPYAAGSAAVTVRHKSKARRWVLTDVADASSFQAGMLCPEASLSCVELTSVAHSPLGAHGHFHFTS